MERLGADSEEKREPVSDIDTAVVDSLKVLDPQTADQRSDMVGLFNHLVGAFILSQRAKENRS